MSSQYPDESEGGDLSALGCVVGVISALIVIITAMAILGVLVEVPRP
jgi:hypothetical protein